MTSAEKMDDYSYRTKSLVEFMYENLSKAMDLLVDVSPVDFEIFKFIYQTFSSIIKANFTSTQFLVASILKEYDDKLIEEFHELEEDLAFQNEVLDKLLSKQTVHTTS